MLFSGLLPIVRSKITAHFQRSIAFHIFFILMTSGDLNNDLNEKKMTEAIWSVLIESTRALFPRLYIALS